MSGNKGVFFSDRKNLNKSSFGKLFRYLDNNSIPYLMDDDSAAFKYSSGDYKHLKLSKEFISKYNQYMAYSRDDLLNVTHYGVNLFDVYRSEALSYYLKMKSFRELLQGNTARASVFNAFFESDKDNLVMCICISVFWLDYWIARLNVISKYKYVGIFSGAQIFNMALIEVSKRSQITPLLMESFFTGNEFYLEEKYEPLPNNTNLKFDNIYNNISIVDYDRLLKDAIVKIANKRNKNNTEGQDRYIPQNNAGKCTITIIAQVVNDFSIILTTGSYLNSVAFYKQLIDCLLQNKNNYVILKTHPWEIKKNKSRITHNEIIQHILTKPYSDRSRFEIIESWDIDKLCNHSDYIITLCSQAGVECAIRGKKIIQFGDAFYGNKGFTHDYTDIKSFINDFSANRVSSVLNSEEVNKVNEFLIKMISRHLVSNLDADERMLAYYFQ